MQIRRLEIENFRNHERTTLQFGDRLNAILGNNGEGKTNIIEAISYLCLTRSFYAANDGITLQQGKERFALHGDFTGDGGIVWSVRVEYDKATQKKSVSVNGTVEDPLSSVIGKFPAVILSPEQNGITFGAPSERRRFMDMVISQSSKIYLEELLEYRRVLRQRNKLLSEAKVQRRAPSGQIEAWNKGLVQRGAKIMQRRRDFLEAVLPAVRESYGQLAGTRERPGMTYVPSFAVEEWSGASSLETLFQKALETSRESETRIGSTLVGPHRDDVDLRVDGLELKHFASQGQHKTFLVALKMAEFGYLKEVRGETPMFLLDDVFSELDEQRGRQVVGIVGGASQTFVTTTDERVFEQTSRWNGANRKFYIHRGALLPESEQASIHEVSG